MTEKGTVLDGKYEILMEVGRGGMSIVYLARDNRLNKQWAVKEIKNDGSKATKTLLKGLEREANILKDVDHPVLPRIVDIINHNSTIYVVMDFIEGTTINDRIKEKGAQPQELVVEWGILLAGALDYLHNMNPPIIYRDMKPSNVMIKPEGGVKLIDFGTAKEYDVENNADTTALGTRGYAAPEQFGDSKGRGIYKTDARTDIYNLGATLYHIVTGHSPSEPPYEIKPIREWNPALSSGLEKIIIKCTQADPNDRYQNCKELIYALEHYTELDDSYRKKNKHKVAGFAATLVMAVAMGVMSFIGYSGIKKITLENYNAYVEQGNEYRMQGDYKSAAEEYKKAFDLDGSSSDAFVRYIQVYTVASDEVTVDGTVQLDLETGLNLIANRIRSEYSNVNENDEVLYNLAMAYFDGLNDYKTSAKYFNMIDKDSDYGELADYYEAVSMTLSNTNVNTSELMDSLNGFASYNQSQYTNQIDAKFVNYKTIGVIYATYVTADGVAEQAEAVMTQAISDIEEYTGTTLDVNDYLYSYYDNLTVIYTQLADRAEDDKRALYYSEAISCCEDYLTILNIKINEIEGVGVGGSNDNIYNTAYYNKMLKIADSYVGMGEYESAFNTYVTLESTMGKSNVLSNRVYSEHLDLMYEYCELDDQDPYQWIVTIPDKLEELLTLYEETKDVQWIEDNATWNKRRNTLDLLESGDYTIGEDVQNPPSDTMDENTSESEIETGEGE